MTEEEYNKELAELHAEHNQRLGDISVATYNQLKGEIIHLQKEYEIEICSSEFAAMVESMIELLVDIVAEGIANHATTGREDIFKAYAASVQRAFSNEFNTTGE